MGEDVIEQEESGICWRCKDKRQEKPDYHGKEAAASTEPLLRPNQGELPPELQSLTRNHLFSDRRFEP